MMFKVGDVKPPARKYGKPCPSCGKAVFEQYPKGFVNEFDVCITVDDDTLTWRENWHCPRCGIWDKKKTHTTNDHGVPATKQKSTEISEDIPVPDVTPVENTSVKPKRKKKTRT